MPFSLEKITRLQTGAILLIAITGLTIFGWEAKWWQAGKTAPVMAASIPVATPPTEEQKPSIPIIFLTLTRFGFQPANVKTQEGKTLFVVRNITGAEDLQFALSNVKGDNLVTEKNKEGKPFWEKPLDLKAGNYTLTAVENPRWSASITVITPEKK